MRFHAGNSPWHGSCALLGIVSLVFIMSRKQHTAANQCPDAVSGTRRNLLPAVLPTLEQRICLVLTGVMFLLLVLVGHLWIRESRHAIHEEVRAATRVAEQFLEIWLPGSAEEASRLAQQALIADLSALGRLRANALLVYDERGELIYQSPDSVWKAGRDAPAWFQARVAPQVVGWSAEAVGLRIELVPDTSRAVLDAWDDLTAALGWGAALLFLVWFGSRMGLRRALSPLQKIDDVLALAADGRFDQRLPMYGVREIDRVATAYNRLADSLIETRADNLRLGDDRDFARALQQRLEAERRVISRELHDELGQGITAVRAIAGSILQRCHHEPQLYGSAQAMLAMTGQMQDGVRTILNRLRRFPTDGGSLHEAMHAHCVQWQQLHPDITLELRLDAIPKTLPEPHAQTLLRVVQEGLTNVARHASASHVLVKLARVQGSLELTVTDDGCGMRHSIQLAGHHGIAGMQERVSELNGELSFERPDSGGVRLRMRLPECAAEVRRT